MRAKVKVHLVIAALVAAVASGYVWLRGETHPFDRTVWFEAPPADKPWESKRATMEDDLVHNVLKPGMTRAEVVALLGTPDSTRHNPANDTVLAYYLGPHPGPFFDIDPDYLEITFDTQQHLTHALINEG